MKITVKKVPERQPYIVRVDPEGEEGVEVEAPSGGWFYLRSVPFTVGRFFTKQEAREYQQKLLEREMLRRLSGEEA